ncbi:MAG: hypothetical protein J5526_03945 [Bacteroidales bacterium]|nr:hypothetical protein [Bacteroidales bacterium]
MKNFFKILGVALIAGSMLFVACKKDEENTNNGNNGGNGGNNTPTDTTTPSDPVNPPAPTAVMTIAIDGQTYQISDFGAGMYSSTSGERFLGQIIYNNTYGLQFPFGGTTTGNYDYDNNIVAIYFTGDDNADWFEYTDDESGETEEYPVWAGCGIFGQSWDIVWSYLGLTQDGPSQNITAIDMNNYTMSCVYYDGLVNLQTYLNEGAFDAGREFTITLTNATWEPVEWSKKNMKSQKNLKKLSF